MSRKLLLSSDVSVLRDACCRTGFTRQSQCRYKSVGPAIHRGVFAETHQVDTTRLWKPDRPSLPIRTVAGKQRHWLEGETPQQQDLKGFGSESWGPEDNLSTSGREPPTFDTEKPINDFWRFSPSSPAGAQISKYESRTMLVKTAREVPRTWTSSEFIFGRSAVKACLLGGADKGKAAIRTMHKLYIYQNVDPDHINTIKAMALSRKIQIEMTPDLSLMDAMAKGRPHNGFVLECEPIPERLIRTFQKFDKGRTVFTGINAGGNMTPTRIQVRDPARCCPFVLVFDEIRDTGNLGAMIRTAYFLGADAIVLGPHSAPVTEVTVKTSSGASEFIPILRTSDVSGFISFCTENGWTAWGASPIPSETTLKKNRTKKTPKWYNAQQLGDPCYHTPCMLVIGNETTGISINVAKHIKHYVTILPSPNINELVDSCNASVAAALIMEKFLRPISPRDEPVVMKSRKELKRMTSKSSVKENGDTMFELGSIIRPQGNEDENDGQEDEDDDRPSPEGDEEVATLDEAEKIEQKDNEQITTGEFNESRQSKNLTSTPGNDTDAEGTGGDPQLEKVATAAAALEEDDDWRWQEKDTPDQAGNGFGSKQYYGLPPKISFGMTRELIKRANKASRKGGEH